MNYNPHYHAGNFADVIKHSILALLIQALTKKEKGVVFIDTHAGAGMYHLGCVEAQKTGEYKQGILKLLQQPNLPDIMAPYLSVIAELNQTTQALLKNNLTSYPGSPVIAKALLRHDDQLIINELHPLFYSELKKTFKQYSRVACHQRNAYEFLPAVLPPHLKRGLILIDPPYENKDEYTQIEKALTTSLMKFENGVYMIWYPIKEGLHTAFCRRLIKQIKQPILKVELRLTNSYTSGLGLIGSGLLIINPPWQIDSQIKQVINYLASVFDQKQLGKIECFNVLK